MDKAKISEILEEIGTLLELKGENPFKSRAYQNASRLILTIDHLEELVRDSKLTTLKGIGEALAEKIETLWNTGKLPYLEELRQSLPPGLLDMIRVQGVGPKRAKLLYDKLKIKDIPGLKKACKDGKVAKLEGFGEKLQENILQGLAFLGQHAEEHRLDEALAAGERILAEINQVPGVRRSSICGSLRRHKEVIRDVDILVSVPSSDARRPTSGQVAKGEQRGQSRLPKAGATSNVGRRTAAILERFVQLPAVERVLGQGETKASVLLKEGIQVDVRVVSDHQYPCALHYFTGSKEHNIAMRQRAQDRGMRLNEYGLFKISSSFRRKPSTTTTLADGPPSQSGGPESRTLSEDWTPASAGVTSVKCKDEAELFKKLGLAYIPPELREDRGEIEAAEKGKLPALIELEDIRGVFHVHSTWSDGRASLEEMIAGAQGLGWAYVGISDHSRSAVYAKGLTPERVSQQRKEIEKLREKFKIHIFWGTECDVLKDGSLDYPDAILEGYDFVIASVHSNYNLSEAEMTARIVRALKNQYVTFLGHMTGRLLLERDGYAVRHDEVLRAAAGEGVALELNAHPQRLDIDWRELPKARELGVKISINPDAHSVGGLQVVRYGVGIARKGWLTQADVLNTLPLSKISSWLKTRRR